MVTVQLITVAISTSAFVLVSIGLLIINWLRNDLNKLREDIKELDKRNYEKDRSNEEAQQMREVMFEMVEKMKKDQATNGNVIHTQQEILKGINSIAEFVNNLGNNH